MKKGDIVTGKITGIKPYGAFVKVNEEMDGLIHISEISDGYVRSIEDFLAVGDTVSLEVLGINPDNKVSLSYKRANKNQKKKYVHVQLKFGFDPLEKMLPVWVEEYQKSRK
jgi:general stress protein 13